MLNLQFSASRWSVELLTLNAETSYKGTQVDHSSRNQPTEAWRMSGRSPAEALKPLNPTKAVLVLGTRSSFESGGASRTKSSSAEKRQRLSGVRVRPNI